MTVFYKTHTYQTLLYLSFLPILWQGLMYAMIGSFYPILIGLAMVILLATVLKYQTTQAPKFLKLWSLLVIVYGSIRILLQLVRYTDVGGIPSNIFYELTVWHGIKSVLLIVLGIYLFRRRSEFEQPKVL